MTRPAPEAAKVGEASVRRHLDREHDLIVLVADFAPLHAAYLDHVQRWESEPDGLSQILMRQGLGAAALHLACRPAGENVAWTINLHRPPTNVFLTGDSGERTVTGRIFTENVRPAESSRMYVQTSRAGGTPVVSTIDVQGHDLLHMFERYYDMSEQTPARFFEATDTEFVMLLGLPDTRSAWLRGLGREEALGLCDDGLPLLDERTYRFQCGCSPQKILEVIRGMFAKDPEELFRGEGGVEVFCPRCGRRWWVERSDFEAE
ncbi:MAG: Hsp33 family molecular chaperone HslO [Candidatus Eiseniibacteriota bacterium]